jgi:capsular polysaccharide biosynthesis protein
MLKPQTAPSSLARDAHARMRDRIGQDNGAAGASLPSLLYIARTDTQRRPLVNEPAVIAMLSALGVEAVVASSLTLEATIALFSRAKLVIGAHGAGMANIAFCRPGCVVYEWHPEHYLETIASTATALVARQSGLHYWADAFPSHGSWAEHGHNVPWSIDLPYLCRRLGQINCIHDLGLPTGPVAPA